MPDRFTVPELLQWLKVDSDLRILFVEGVRDLTFWETLVPHLERRNIQIYAISSVEVPVNNNGERGRLVACARAFSHEGAPERVRFFMDADNSRVLDETILKNITLTDGRDLESYGLTQDCARAICVTGFSMTQAKSDTFWIGACVSLRPVGILIIASARNDWRLPFQKTLGEGALKRYFVEVDSISNIDIERVISALRQNAAHPRVPQAMLALGYNAELERMQVQPNDQVVHGKDYVGYLRYQLRCTFDQAYAYLFLGMAAILDDIRRQPNLASIEQWIRGSG